MWTASHRADGKHRKTFLQWYKVKRLKQPEYFIHQAAKRRAKNYGVPFAITMDDIKSVWPHNNRCPITEEAFTKLRGGGRGRTLNTPSLDRINPALGYIPGNIAIISLRANYIKSCETNPQIFRRMASWLEAVTPKAK